MSGFEVQELGPIIKIANYVVNLIGFLLFIYFETPDFGRTHAKSTTDDPV